MTISTLAELRAAVQNWTHRSSLASARIDEFIFNAEGRIRKEIRVREMETDATVTVSAQTASLPTGFIGMRRFYLTTDPIALLKFVSPEDYWSSWGSSRTGQPQEFTIEGDLFKFGPTPDTTYTGKALCYALTSLLTTVPTLFTNHPDLYLYATLVESAPYLANTARLGEWEALYQRSKATVERSDRRDRQSSGSLTMRPSTTNP